MSGGTFSVSRKIWEHEVFIPSPFSEREAFLWLVSEASWKPRRKRVGSVIVNLDRGQLSHSTRFLSDAWQWSHSKVRRFLDRLEKYDMIRRQSDTGVSVISLTNYDAYQMGGQSSGTAAAQQRHSSGTNDKKGEIKGRKDTSSSNDDFDVFWSNVPRKVGKGQARKAYATALKKTTPEELLEGIKRHASAMKGKDPQFIPHPSTWLSGERWTDEVQADTRKWYEKPESEWTKADRDAERMRHL